MGKSRLMPPAQAMFAEEKPMLLPPQKMRNYYKSVADHKDVTKLVLMLTSSVNSFREQITGALKGYEKFNFLWEQDRDEVLFAIFGLVYLYVVICDMSA